MKVPFNDLAAQHASIRQELDGAIHNALNSFNFVRGQAVHDFENAFASLLQIKHCIATGNGTDALFIALKTLGIGAGDEVITPAFSWISSAEVISMCNATPVFADVHPGFFTIDPEKIETLITSKTKAIIVVHLYGQAAQVREIKKICNRRGLKLIEDCAQAHLTKDGDDYVGTIGDVAAFSFYPTKNLGAYGDAGCIVLNDNAHAEKIRRFANHGALQKDDHEIEGINSRMDTVQAAVLLAKLPHLIKWNDQRQRNAAWYTEQLKSIEALALPAVRAGTEHTFHLYVVRTAHRKALQDFLAERDVQTIVHYPAALPFLPPYQALRRDDKVSVANLFQHQVLSLPVHPELTQEQIAYVCENIQEFFQK